MTKFFLILLLAFIIISCKKPEERSCLKRSGDKTKEIVTTGEFNRLSLMEHLSYVLVQDTVSYVVLEGGKNLLGFVDCSNMENQLTIANNNKCKFLRYKTGDIQVEIHFKKIDQLIFQGTQLLTNRGEWNFDQLEVILKDTGGSMNLTNFNGSVFKLINVHGWGDITLSGGVNYFQAEMNGNGYFDSRNFNVQDSISVISNSSTISKLNSENCSLKAQLKAMGDLWYYGNPSQIWKQELAKGKLVDMN
jgi:hypothetical protein